MNMNILVIGTSGQLFKRFLKRNKTFKKIK